MPRDPLSEIMRKPMNAKIRRKDSLADAAGISRRNRGIDHTVLLQAGLRASTAELKINGPKGLMVQRVAANYINALGRKETALADKHKTVLRGILLERFEGEEQVDAAIRTILTTCKRALETH